MTQDPTTEPTGETSGEPVATEPASAAPAVYTKVDSKQLRSLVDVTVADLRRELAKFKTAKLTPANVELLGRVAERSAKFAIKVRTTPDNDLKAIQKLDAERKQIESQLKAIKSIGSVLTAKKVFAVVDAAIDRLTGFAVAAVLSL